ncbi:uncharacterized protein LOC117328985 isoform X2 [Pecten maximus]|nr:uncharacterized protein LOC117328985 isoform X2 [Pecten maximus]XP_033742531.1 uncharacterized protein LOC117328985 isoform X2 [Pecten maximus]
MLRKQLPRHFGHTKLQHTKRQEEESMLIQEDNSLLSYSMRSEDSESTYYGSKQLNSSGDSFVPRVDARLSGESWIDKSRCSQRRLNTFSLTEQESKRPNQGLETFSLAEQVDDPEDGVELLSLQETMMTFIKDDHGEPSDAETLSSTSSDTSNQWQDDGIDNNEDVINIESDKSEIDSDKSDVGDITTYHKRENTKDSNMWNSPRGSKGVWLDRKEDQFTLISSSQDGGISNLHDGIRPSDGVEWSVSQSPCSQLTHTNRWVGRQEAVTHSKTSLTDRDRSTERYPLVSSIPTLGKQESHKKSPKNVFRSPVKNSMVNRISAHDMHVSDEVDGEMVDTNVLHSFIKKTQQQEDGFHSPSRSSKRYLPRHHENTHPDLVVSDDRHQVYSTNHQKSSGRPKSEFKTEGTVNMAETEGQTQSRPQDRNSQMQQSRTPVITTTKRTKSFEELVSKSVPSKLMVQDLKDLPQGKLTASTIAMDPLTSMEKVYRWLSPATTSSDQRHKVSARRRLQLANVNSANVVREDKANTFDNKLEVRFIPKELRGNTDCLEQMDVIGTESENLNKYVESKGRLIEQNLSSPKKQYRDLSMWENSYLSEGQPVTPNTDKRRRKSPNHTPKGFQNKHPWENSNTTPRRNRASHFSSELTSSPRNNISPKSPWRSRSCDQRFHPYSRKNPDSPSAIFARLKLSISSPSSCKDTVQNHGVVEKPSGKMSTFIPTPKQTRNHNLGNDMISPSKLRQHFKQTEEYPNLHRSNEKEFPVEDNLYYGGVSRKFMQESPISEKGRNQSPEKISRKQDSISSDRGHYLKRLTTSESNSRSFDLFETFDLERSSQRSTVLNGQHFLKPRVGAPQQNEFSEAHKYPQTHQSTCHQNNSSSTNLPHSTCQGSKVKQQNNVQDNRNQSNRGQKSEFIETISPMRNTKYSRGHDLNRRQSYQKPFKQDKLVPKDDTAGQEKSQRFLSLARWKGINQENDRSAFFSSMQDSGVECTFKGYSDHADAKHGVTSNLIKSNVQEKPLHSTCDSPLVKISSKPKAVRPSTNVQAGSEASQRSHQKGVVAEKTELFKRPMGAIVSLRNKVLANNQLHSSTPMKHSPQFTLNDTLSTIHATNSDIDSDSSDELVLTISPSY